MAPSTDERWHKARLTLTDEGVDRLAQILADGSMPTVGLFVRFRKPTP